VDRSIDNDAREPDERTDIRPAHVPEREAREAPRPYEVARLREQIDSVTTDQPSFSDLFERLQQLGIRPVPSLQKSGRLNGMSYEWNGIRYRGSELGRGYTAAGLQKSKGVRYDPERDDPRLREAEKQAREHPGRTLSRSHDLRDRSARAQEYDALSESERAAMREVGRFRSVLLEDLIVIQYRGDEYLWKAEFAKLAAQNLMETRSVVIATHDRNHQTHTRSLQVVVLTKAGKDLLRRFDRESREASQALYAGFVKPREIAHDSAIYRMYHAEAAHIEKQGGHVKRVILDFELKKKAYSPLAKARRVSVEEYNRKQREIADELGLKVVGGKMRLPDLRIEYETANGDAARVDLELATEHYRGDHMAAKEGAGFKIYADSRSFPPGGSYGRSSVFDDHAIEIFSF
jgi:hypothetical protein